jgi:putative ABC transport system permease protein
MNSFRQEARRIGGVREIAVANFIPGKEIVGTARGYVRPLGTAEELAKFYSFTKVGFDFMPAMDINLLSGRFFDAQFAGDRTFGESVILNEEASRQLGFATPQAAIGQRIIYRVNSTPTIVGVVENFHQYSLQRNFQAIIFEPTLIPQSYYYLKLSGTDKTRIPELKALWETHFGGNAFSYFFLDEFYAAQYQRENRFMQAFNLFSLLAILVSAMGFFGLVYYSATKRTKEIGIRRTFGAAYWDIFSILAQGLGLLILLSSVISIPLVYLLSGDWLTHYAFRIEIAWWMLLLPVGLLVSITLLIVFLQSLQSYRMNPVAALREE